MSATLITMDTVKRLAPPPKGNAVIWDSGKGAVTGFGVRITAKGAISFVLRYVSDGRERRMTIGKYPDLTVKVAREMAGDFRAEVSKGGDPLSDRERRRDSPTVANLAVDYMERHATSKASQSAAEDKSMLNQHILPRLGSVRLAHLTSRDIEKLHLSLKNTPYRANRILSLIGKMLRLAVQWKWEDADPSILGTVKKYPEEKRRRWLSTDELRALTKALDAHPNQQSADIVRLLILTGARRGEVLAAEWSEFDLARGTWTKPSHHTKQKRTEHFPLSAAATQLLTELQADANSLYVFPSSTGDVHQGSIKNFWRGIKNTAGLNDVRIHDLRHTFASHLVSSGHSLEMVGRLLGHTQAHTTHRYAHLADDPLREASDRIGTMFQNLVNGKAGDIVPMDAGRRK